MKKWFSNYFHQFCCLQPYFCIFSMIFHIFWWFLYLQCFFLQFSLDFHICFNDFSMLFMFSVFFCIIVFVGFPNLFNDFSIFFDGQLGFQLLSYMFECYELGSDNFLVCWDCLIVFKVSTCISVIIFFPALLLLDNLCIVNI